METGAAARASIGAQPGKGARRHLLTAMNDEPNPLRPAAPRRWLPPLVLAVLGVGIGAAAWHWELARRPRPAPPVAEDPMSDAVIRRALEAAGAEGERTEKARWVDEVPGVDLAALSPARREVFLRFANAERCTCDCGYTLAGCRNYDPDCDVSLPMVRALLDSVRRGLTGPVIGLREPPARRR